MPYRSTLSFAATAMGVWLACPAPAMSSEAFFLPGAEGGRERRAEGICCPQRCACCAFQPRRQGLENLPAKKTMTGAKTCSVVAVHLDEPKMQLRQTGYSCKFPAVFKIDKALRERLSRCVAGEVDEDSDPDKFTI